MENELENLISVTQAAEKLGLSRKRVFEFVKDGRLPARKVGAAYIIKETDLPLIANRSTGRPPLENPSKATLAKRKQREQQKNKPE